MWRAHAPLKRRMLYRLVCLTGIQFILSVAHAVPSSSSAASGRACGSRKERTYEGNIRSWFTNALQRSHLVPKYFECSDAKAKLEEDLRPVLKVFHPRCALEIFRH